ncbi:hypothetical protein [Eoetvoesiella caeni]|uniref:Uncharacterized protein n=1 Tax=Eoetvoesiella caeni TaxID=645616 RepID=A0A366H9L5_9BURK|nr:hypothetical protein DFR37_10793 [Eoetvoesiella caeni]
MGKPMSPSALFQKLQYYIGIGEYRALIQQARNFRLQGRDDSYCAHSLAVFIRLFLGLRFTDGDFIADVEGH